MSRRWTPFFRKTPFPKDPMFPSRDSELSAKEARIASHAILDNGKGVAREDTSTNAHAGGCFGSPDSFPREIPLRKAGRLSPWPRKKHKETLQRQAMGRVQGVSTMKALSSPRLSTRFQNRRPGLRQTFRSEKHPESPIQCH